MTVYVQSSMLIDEYATRLVKAEVIAVHEHGIDFRLEDGTTLLDWREKVYDQYEKEIPLERIKRDFVSNDPAALLDRIAALEILLTEV